MSTTPLVSIVTLAFNHGRYLRQCLDGFVMQITDFTFEVIIHDDASTDDTAQIIREYEEKYPHIFKAKYDLVIYCTEPIVNLTLTSTAMTLLK
jgi:glycosyltransferase involved in cell wall biosynthesis